MKNVKRTKLTGVQSRVTKGIALLNEEYGKSWLRKIDPERLALEDSKSCVLGQIEGEYDAGCDKLGIMNGGEYGFNRYYSVRGRRPNYSTLTRTWKRSIVKLQKLFSIDPPTFQ